MTQKILLLVALLLASASQAAGVAIDTQSARATGMAMAVVANQRDAAALFYNPAGILGVQRLEVQAGVTGIIPRVRFTDETGREWTQEFSLIPPPHAYAVWSPTESVSVGLGLATPWGNSITWPADFPGRFISQHSRLEVYELLPSVAYQPLPGLRLGIGGRVAPSRVVLERQLLPTAPGNVRLEASDLGIGLQAGAQVDALDGLLTLGVLWRSQLRLGFDGDADFREVPALLEPLFRDQPISAGVRLPASLVLGASVRPLRPLTVAVDVSWVGWSTLERLVIDFEDDALDTTLEKSWQDRWLVRVGAEYEARPGLLLRAGFSYDPTPAIGATLTPELPDADRLLFALGLGYQGYPFRADVGYQFLVLVDKRSTFPGLPGTYGGQAHVLAATLGYSW